VNPEAGAARKPDERLRRAAFIPELIQWRSDPPQFAPRDEGSGAGTGAQRPLILLADDNADMRHYIAGLLAPDYRVEMAGNGAEALRAALKNPPALVLSDVMMPELDGFGLLAALRNDERTQLVPVMLLSARAGEEARSEGIGAGADDIW
jgi:CheY-like chemotaxis protein